MKQKTCKQERNKLNVSSLKDINIDKPLVSLTEGRRNLGKQPANAEEGEATFQIPQTSRRRAPPAGAWLAPRCGCFPGRGHPRPPACRSEAREPPPRPHQLPVRRRPVGHEAVHLAPQRDGRQRVFEQASREQPPQLRDRRARRPRAGRAARRGAAPQHPGTGLGGPASAPPPQTQRLRAQARPLPAHVADPAPRPRTEAPAPRTSGRPGSAGWALRWRKMIASSSRKPARSPRSCAASGSR